MYEKIPVARVTMANTAPKYKLDLSDLSGWIAKPMKQRIEPNQSSSEKNPVSSWIKRQYQGMASFLLSSFGPT
jgi:hypothetical protein